MIYHYTHINKSMWFIQCHKIVLHLCMRGSKKICQRGSNFDNVFLVDEGREDPSTTISGPSSARQRNAFYGPLPPSGSAHALSDIQIITSSISLCSKCTRMQVKFGKLLYGCVYIREIIHSLKLMDCLPVHTHKLYNNCHHRIC